MKGEKNHEYKTDKKKQGQHSYGLPNGLHY